MVYARELKRKDIRVGKDKRVEYSSLILVLLPLMLLKRC